MNGEVKAVHDVKEIGMAKDAACKKEIKHRWIWLAAVTAVGFFIDVGTKHLAHTRLEYGMPTPVIGDYLQWLLIYNKGAVFGIPASELFPWIPANTFFIIFMSIAIAFLLLYYKMLKKSETLMHVGLMLVLPGAFGNLHDRIVHGEKGVVDFIRMGIPPDNYWFIYNIADVFVTFGVAVMLISFWMEAKKTERKTAAAIAAIPEETAQPADGEQK